LASSTDNNQIEKTNTSLDVVLVIFRVGPDLYSIDVSVIQEVIPVIAATKVPSAPDFIEGVIELRKLIVPVVDLRARLGYAKTDVGKRARYLIVSVSGRIVAMMVDEVIEIAHVNPSSFSPAPEIIRDAGVKYVCGVLRRNGLTLVLDLEGALSQKEIAALKEMDQVSLPGKQRDEGE